MALGPEERRLDQWKDWLWSAKDEAHLCTADAISYFIPSICYNFLLE